MKAQAPDTAPDPKRFPASTNSVQPPVLARSAPVPNPQAPRVPDHQLLRRIGAGSYGEVWLARNAIGTLRAVKIVHRQSFERVEHFEREFKGLQKFEPISRSHDGFVDILQIGRDDAAGYFYYVMELADGEPIQNEATATPSTISGQQLISNFEFYILNYRPTTLRSAQQRVGRLPVDECVQIGLALVSALDHLHTHGLVHRDIKPSNIIFVNGAPKLADIGLVTAIDEAHSLVGTAGYIPPEGPGAPQADLYSLGKVLYEISLGKDRQDFPQLPADLQSHPNHAALLELNEVTVKACETDPRKRYQTARQLHGDLALLQQGQSVKRQRAVERRFTIARRTGLAATALTLIIMGFWLLSPRFNAPPVKTEINSIAVLPFANQSTKTEHEYLSNALTDETMNALTNCSGLRVAPRSAVLAFKRATNDLRQIGERLGVRTILAGTFLRDSNGMRLAIQLINASDGAPLWSGNLDRGRDELHLLGAELALRAARALNFQLEERAIEQLQTNLVRKLRAYRLREDAVKHPRNTKAGLNKQIELLNQAIVEDTEYARAYADLAQAYGEATDFILPPAQAQTEARKNAMRALQVDPSLTTAHMTLGWVLFNYDWDAVKAEEQIERAVKLDPNNAGVHQSYATLLLCLGRFEQAERVLKQAERLDPKNQGIQLTWCWLYFCDHRFEDQLHAAKRVLTLHTNNFAAWMHHAWALERLDRLNEALMEAQRLVDRDAAPDTLAFLGFVHGRMGHRAEAEKVLERLRELAETTGYVSGFFPAQIWMSLGETNRALDCLEQAVQQHSARIINQLVDPRLDPLRANPRFIALLKRVGLEK